MLARPFILQAEMLARICPRIASLSENTRHKTSSRVDTRLVSVASESDRGSIPLLSYTPSATMGGTLRHRGLDRASPSSSCGASCVTDIIITYK